MSNESRLKRAKAYLKQRGIAATATDSKLVYRDSAGVKREPPEFLKKQEEASVIELPRRVK